ncbi:MAG: hypothetical protein AB7I33_09540 [Gemmatimonadales bacterium]
MRAHIRATRIGAVFYALWGIIHILGGATQLFTLRSHGPGALTALIATASPPDPTTVTVPPAAAAFMGMGAWNILWIGLLVTIVAVTLNWRNDRLGYWLNLGVVLATDLGLLAALLLPGHMAWSDGLIGIVLFLLAAGFSAAGRSGRAPELAPAGAR